MLKKTMTCFAECLCSTQATHICMNVRQQYVVRMDGIYEYVAIP